jgi:hypothetical protein
MVSENTRKLCVDRSSCLSAAGTQPSTENQGTEDDRDEVSSRVEAKKSAFCII